jgi:hypothetical protein
LAFHAGMPRAIAAFAAGEPLDVANPEVLGHAAARRDGAGARPDPAPPSS